MNYFGLLEFRDSSEISYRQNISIQIVIYFIAFGLLFVKQNLHCQPLIAHKTNKIQQFLYLVRKPQEGILFSCGLSPKMNPQMGWARSLKFVAKAF